MLIQQKGEGLLNKLINHLPFELHLPSYQYCGPGTKLEKRLQRGDSGINPLDTACRDHDIAYRDYKDIKDRHQADKVLQEKSWGRVKSRDASFGERTAALAVAGAMNVKRKLGMGCTRRKRKHNSEKKRKSGGSVTHKKKKLSFKSTLKKIGKLCSNGKAGKGIMEKIKNALGIAHRVIKTIGKQNLNVPRVIPVPKQGGFIPFLIPLFAGLSAAGALAGGASGIAKAVNDAKEAKKQLEESSRHNQAMEAIALGKKGSGLYLKPYKASGSALYLKPYKTGSSLYLKPYSKNS